MAFNSPITVDQGTTFNETFVVQVLTNQALPFNVNTNPYIPLNLTGASMNMMVRADYDKSVALLTCSSANGKITCMSPATGAFTVALAPADTSNIPASNFQDDTFTGVYDIEVTDASGNVIRPVQGTFTVNREVTR